MRVPGTCITPRTLLIFPLLLLFDNAFCTANPSAFSLASFEIQAAFPSQSKPPQILRREPFFDVPYVPTPAEVVDEMLRLAAPRKGEVIYDLGCGDGRIIIAAALKYDVRGVGIDIDPQRIKEANEHARAAGVADRVRFLQQDLFHTDLREADIVTLYLLPSVNLKLRPKLLKELRPGVRLVSHNFDMGDWRADKIVTMNKRLIYFWTIPHAR